MRILVISDAFWPDHTGGISMSLLTEVRDAPRVMDFQFGATLAPLVSAWIQRLSWPDKPVVSFGKVLGETYRAQFFSGTAPSLTFLEEAYINFHIAGLLWVAMLSGIVLRAMYCYLLRPTIPSGVLIYSFLFPYVIMFSDIVALLTMVVFGAALSVLGSVLLGFAQVTPIPRRSVPQCLGVRYPTLGYYTPPPQRTSTK